MDDWTKFWIVLGAMIILLTVLTLLMTVVGWVK